MINSATSEFIREHRDDDVRRLAFVAANKKDVDVKIALDQIQGYQTARKKMPMWYDHIGIIYPPHINMEQCSSESTARYKARVAKFDLNGGDSSLLIDLTGGFGVDFSFMSSVFTHAIYVERNPLLCEIAENNFEVLDLRNFAIANEDSTDYVDKLPQIVDKYRDDDGRSLHVCVFMDPARRDDYGRKTVTISDCTPNVLSLLPAIDSVADKLVIKLSPMLDWHEALREINDGARSCASRLRVSEIHAVSVKNEGKELLFVVEKEVDDDVEPMIFCVNDDNVYSCTLEEAKAKPVIADEETAMQSSYLYVPNASVMKMGCFAIKSNVCSLKEVENNSHLFVADALDMDFPGRAFSIASIVAMTGQSKKIIKRKLSGITKANVAVRNFPMTADALRKRLKVHDGGDIYIFGTTLSSGSHVLIITKKVI